MERLQKWERDGKNAQTEGGNDEMNSRPETEQSGRDDRKDKRR